MKQYLDLMRDVIENGTQQSNRTGIDTIFIAGSMMKFDLADGFPVVTTRKAAWKSAIGEMIGFINGYTDVREFQKLKCKFWDENVAAPAWQNNQNCDGPYDMGEIYGYQARKWDTGMVQKFHLNIDATTSEVDFQVTTKDFDQLAHVIEQIHTNPTSRRLLVSHWRPDRFDHMSLPPCHVLYQFLVNVEKQELNMSMYIRSNDLFLGAPANITEYAFLLAIVAHATGLTPRVLTYFVSDAHVYINHLEQVKTQLEREPYALPKLKFLKPFKRTFEHEDVLPWMESLHPDDFELEGYQHHEPLTGSMAV